MSTVDELAPVVLEIGSSSTRAGFAGDISPKIVIPTAYARCGDGEYTFGESIHDPKPNTDIFLPMSDGCVQDWNAITNLLRYIYNDRLDLSPSDQPLLMPEQAWNTVANKQRNLEVVFEDLEVPIFSIAKAPVCAAFESSKATALVVDVGSAVASAVPVVDGVVVQKGVQHSKIAGDFLNLHIMENFKKRSIQVTPYFKVISKSQVEPGQPPKATLDDSVKDLTDSYLMYETSSVLTEFKETTTQVCAGQFSANELSLLHNIRPFEFPDGYNISFGVERFACCEALFAPHSYPLQEIPLPYGAVGLSELIYNALAKADLSPDVQAGLLSNVVVSGGSSLLQGLTGRLLFDLSRQLPNFQSRISTGMNATDRKLTVWTGASILASLPTYDGWVSRAEYDEYGAAVLSEKKFK